MLLVTFVMMGCEPEDNTLNQARFEAGTPFDAVVGMPALDPAGSMVCTQAALTSGDTAGTSANHAAGGSIAGTMAPDAGGEPFAIFRQLG